MHDKLVKTLLSADEVALRVKEVGQIVTDFYTDQSLTVLGVMTGGLVFCADLIRQLDLPLQLGVLHARSYVGTQSGDLSVWTDTLPDLRGRSVLVVDDIFDTGRTLDRVVREIQQLGPKSVHSAVLLRKSVHRDVVYEPDWVAFDISNEFVVGYGLDFNGDYRQLPCIGVLSDDDASRSQSLTS